MNSFYMMLRYWSELNVYTGHIYINDRDVLQLKVKGFTKSLLWFPKKTELAAAMDISDTTLKKHFEVHISSKASNRLATEVTKVAQRQHA